MSRRKKQRHDDHADTHRWVISYADFITLLFAFFVVMYAISSVNVSKYRSMSEGMQSAFNKDAKQKAPTEVKTPKSGQTASKAKNNAATSGAGTDIFKSLEAAFKDLADANDQVIRKEGWIEMDIKANSLFDSGSADLTPAALNKIMEIAKLLKDIPYPIRIEGFTDSIPISTSEFPSNWELSTARASAIARVLNDFGVANDRISVTGYNDQYPVADNTNEAGRIKNRRVNLLIVKDKNSPRLNNPQYGS